MFSGPPRQSYECFESADDLSEERSMARVAATAACCLAMDGSNSSEGRED